jgi:hypothetical protein
VSDIKLAEQKLNQALANARLCKRFVIDSEMQNLVYANAHKVFFFPRAPKLTLLLFFL